MALTQDFLNGIQERYAKLSSEVAFLCQELTKTQNSKSQQDFSIIFGAEFESEKSIQNTVSEASLDAPHHPQ